MKKALILTVTAMLFLAGGNGCRAQQEVNVLFIGNSYTEVNNLPQMTADIAASRGRNVTWRSNTPGGCTFSQHCTNQSMSMIAQGGWDIVVLQEQSQYPSFPQQQVEAEVFPYAAQLVEAVYAASPCAEPMFYMTWGRRDGDQQNAQYFPVLGTYEGMDSMLYERYMYMAASNDASVSPVGRVWRWLRRNNPEIELYQSDGSHPSTAGTYAAACSFYVMFFHESPDSIRHVPSGVTEQTAASIRQAVHEVVYQQLSQWQRPLPQAAFEASEAVDGEVLFTLQSAHTDSIMLDFGDGTWYAGPACESVTHRYADSGSYGAMLIAMRHCMTDMARLTVQVATPSPTGIALPSTLNARLSIYPNPATSMPTVEIDGQAVEKTDIVITTLDGRRQPYGQLQPGEYLLQVNHHGTPITARLVIVAQ